MSWIEQRAAPKTGMLHVMCSGMSVAVQPGMLRNVSLFVLIGTAACANSSDLQGLKDRQVDVSVGNGIAVWLGYDGIDDGVSSDCFSLDDVGATFNGVSADDVDPGGWAVLGDASKGTCTSPHFSWNNPPTGSGTLHIADGSAAIDVTISDALSARTLALSGSVLHNKSSVTLVPSIPATDTVTSFEIYADEKQCGDQLFDVTQSNGSAGYQVTLPDADAVVGECDPSLAPVQAVVEIEIFTAAKITTCSGASSCSATASGATSTTVMFAP